MVSFTYPSTYTDPPSDRPLDPNTALWPVKWVRALDMLYDAVYTLEWVNSIIQGTRLATRAVKLLES